jgi:hypothetical protein
MLKFQLLRLRNGAGMHSLTGYAGRSIARALSLLLALISLAGCGPNRPDVSGLKDFTNRALVQHKDGVTVWTSVLTDEECRRYFGASTADVDVQPVWIQIKNDNDKPLRYLPILTDPEYFAPQEAAQRLHGWFSTGRNAAIDELFESSAVGNYVPANQTISGFLYTNADGGLKFLTVALIGIERYWLFRFIVPVTGVQYAVQSVDFSKLYPAGTIEDLSLDQLRKQLQNLQCCVTSKTGKANGDPLNLVVVGYGVDAIFPFVRRGWHLNEPVDKASSYRMAKAFLTGRKYDTAPVSPLYLFNRYQDIALQKARSSISQRNHLRLWQAPFTLEGKTVWIGQISRDIGIKLTTKSWSLTTHRVSAYVDQERDYLLQDLLLTGFVDRFGYVTGVGESTPDHARVNLTDDPYYTDGLRLVIFLGSEPHTPAQIQPLDWERPVLAK